MTSDERYGATKIATIRRKVNRLRAAIRAHNTEETEAAWDDCEPFVDRIFKEQK